jgi:hypothetical protein
MEAKKLSFATRTLRSGACSSSYTWILSWLGQRLCFIAFVCLFFACFCRPWFSATVSDSFLEVSKGSGYIDVKDRSSSTQVVNNLALPAVGLPPRSHQPLPKVAVLAADKWKVEATLHNVRVNFRNEGEPLSTESIILDQNSRHRRPNTEDSNGVI